MPCWEMDHHPVLRVVDLTDLTGGMMDRVEETTSITNQHSSTNPTREASITEVEVSNLIY